MSYKVLSKCPVCSKKLKVTKLQCSSCGTTIENEFSLSKFEYLNADQLNFVEIFLKSRGSIKEVEKELGISYPTVRAKLDEVISALGYDIPKKSSVNNTEILDMLERGEITSEQAVEMLKS
ncbi:DUF2089 domain-containing protein [Clostridium algidicarnis]|uniref:DUF2089 domain-containing protein n=1 Tax=Clostridium algidicarnis TaxID=37659 RepID=UPI001C0CED15|nr:DUF2089 domain-containing protein [Clostridium algidicarnis]MBU3196771.1 DUF2089 domain-containing protein [Clostridium algidicarnis]